MKTPHVIVSSIAAVAGAALLTGCGSAASQGSAGPSGLAASSGGSSTPPGSAAPSAVATESNPAGDIPDNQAYVTYSPSSGGFSMKVPEGWARSATTQGVVFSDKYNSVRVSSTAMASKPTTASVTSDVLPTVRSSSPGFASAKVSTVDRRAGQAILLTYQADSAPNIVTGKVAVEAVEMYIFWKQGTEAVLTLSAPTGSDNVDPWRAVTDSFTWSA